MISYTEKITPKDLENFPASSIKTRILSLFSGYGADLNFLDFWLQKENGVTTAVICRFERAVWLLSGDSANRQELRSFLGAITTSVLTDKQTVERLNLESEKEFYLMRKTVLGKSEAPTAPSVSLLYDMLMQGADGDIEIPNRDEWYADLSHRFRHGTAVAVAEDDAAALAGFVCDDSALITGVATAYASRGKGKGSKAVSRLCELLGGKTVWAEASEGTRDFYYKCGFTEAAKICRCNVGG